MSVASTARVDKQQLIKGTFYFSRLGTDGLKKDLTHIRTNYEVTIDQTLRVITLDGDVLYGAVAQLSTELHTSTL